MIPANSFCTISCKLIHLYFFATTAKMVATEEHFADASSGPSTHDKNTRKKRMAKVPAIKNTKAKKQKVDAAAATYEKYVKHGKPLRRSHANEQV